MYACMYMSIYVNMLDNNMQMYVWDVLIESPSSKGLYAEKFHIGFLKNATPMSAT